MDILLPRSGSSDYVRIGEDEVIRRATFADRKPKILFGLFFIALGILLLWTTEIVPTFVFLSAQTWPTVTAVIQESSVSHSQDSNNNTSYHFDVYYAYSYEGKDYHSTNCSTISEGSQIEAQTYAHRYPVGAQVAAYVWPFDPAYAVLDRSKQTWPIYWVFILFPLIGAWQIADVMKEPYVWTGKRWGKPFTLFFSSIDEAQKYRLGGNGP